MFFDESPNLSLHAFMKRAYGEFACVCISVQMLTGRQINISPVRGHDQGHPKVTAASTPALQNLFVSHRERSSQSEGNRESVFVFTFFLPLSKYPRLSFHQVLRFH